MFETMSSRRSAISREAGLARSMWVVSGAIVVVTVVAGVAMYKSFYPTAAPAAKSPVGTPKVGSDSLNLSLTDQISAIREHPDGSVGIEVHITAKKPGSGPSTVAAADTWSWRGDMDEDSKRIAKAHGINPDTRKSSDIAYIRQLKLAEDANRSRAADILHDCNVQLGAAEAKVKKAEGLVAKATDKVAKAAPADKAKAEAELTTAKAALVTAQAERDSAKIAVDEAKKVLDKFTK